MDNKEITNIATDIISLNQKYFANEITTNHMVRELDHSMQEMSLEDLLILGCALTFISESGANT